MDPLEARIFAASLRDDLPTIDLHGLTISQALEKLDVFLYTIYERHETSGRVITGIGSGALQQAVEQYLKEHVAVQTYSSGAGSVIVLMK